MSKSAKRVGTSGGIRIGRPAAGPEVFGPFRAISGHPLWGQKVVVFYHGKHRDMAQKRGEKKVETHLL